MKDKKGFILYDDYKESFELLNDKDIKELLFAIFDYHKNDTINHLSSTAKMAFMFIKNDLDRQLDNYNKICKRNRENGLKGGRPLDKPKEPTGLIDNPEKPRISQKSQQDTNKIQTRYKQDNKQDNKQDEKKKTFKQYTKQDFINEVKSFSEFLEHHDAFINYWTETNDKNKMKFQLQKTWKTKNRLTTWSNNNFSKQSSPQANFFNN